MEKDKVVQAIEECQKEVNEILNLSPATLVVDIDNHPIEWLRRSVRFGMNLNNLN